MANLQKIVYLTKAEYTYLVQNGTLTKGGRTITYNENDLYVTPEDGRLEHTLTFGAGQQYVFDGSEDVTVPVYLGTYRE